MKNKKLRNKMQWFLCLLLSFVLLVTSILSFPISVSAASTVALSTLSSGDTVKFAGYTWIVLNPSSGYLLMQGVYGNDRQFDSSLHAFDSSRTTNIGYYLNNTFLGNLSNAQKAMIQSHVWTTGSPYYEGNYTDTCKVGLISGSELAAYKSLVALSLANGWWSRTRYADVGPETRHDVCFNCCVYFLLCKYSNIGDS